MKSLKQKNVCKKIALILSLCALILWCILGTGASLAWFSDASPEVENIFHFADFEVGLSYLDEHGNWVDVEGESDLFDDTARYEPGYVQTLFLRVENKGDVEFLFTAAVNVNNSIPSTNVFGTPLWLHEHLKFGLIVTDSQADMLSAVSTREKAALVADSPLQNYATNSATIGAGEFAYIALVVRMPEEVGNISNHNGSAEPMVDLGITVKAEQKR